MKKTILILSLICFLTPAAFADVKGYGPQREVADRDTFEMNQQVLQEIEAAKNNPNYQQQQQNYQNQYSNFQQQQQNYQNQYSNLQNQEQHLYPTADEYAQRAQQNLSDQPQSQTVSSKKDKKSKKQADQTKQKKGGVRFKGQGSSPAQTQYQFGRPDYGFRQNY